MVQSAGRAGSVAVPTADFVPYYREIINDLLAQIADGRLKPGDQLPSTTALVTHYKRSPGTVRKAIETMIEDGALRGHQGVAVFVAGKPPQGSPGGVTGTGSSE
jgi:DNA-binding GntR family transcriptional regulator